MIRGYVLSGLLHCAALAAAHTLFMGVEAVLWRIPSGAATLELQAHFDSSEQPSPAAEVAVVEPPPPELETLAEFVRPSDSHVEEPAALPTMPQAELAAAPDDVGSLSGRSAAVRWETNPEATRDVTELPRQERELPPPAVASTVNLASEFTAGELEKSVPQPVYNPAPIYPPELLAAGQSGLVVVRADIDSTGKVVACEVHRPSGYPAFDAAALAAVRGWRFEPAVRFGIPVATRILCPIRFRFTPP